MISMTALGIHLKVADIEKSRAFYDALGFKRVNSFGPDMSSTVSYHGTIYQIGESGLIEIADAHELVPEEVWHAPIANAKVTLFVKVLSLIPVIEAARRHNIPIADDPRWFPWGTFEMTIHDPDKLWVVFVSQDSVENKEALQQITQANVYRTEPDYSKQ